LEPTGGVMRGILLACLAVLALLALSGCVIGGFGGVIVKDQYDALAVDCLRNNWSSPKTQMNCLAGVGVKPMQEGGNNGRYTELCADFAPMILSGRLEYVYASEETALTRAIVYDCEQRVKEAARGQGIVNFFTLPQELYNEMRETCDTHRCIVEWILAKNLPADLCHYAEEDTDICLWKVAMQRKDPSQCKYYLPLASIVCYYNVAHDTGDIALCEKIREVAKEEEGLYQECREKTWTEYRQGKTTSYVDEAATQTNLRS